MLNDFSDLTILLQGPITTSNNNQQNSTKNTVENIRKIFPSVEIILSTWNYEDTTNIKANKIIFNSDPGAVLFEEGGPLKFNNINRMLVSTQNGLKEVHRKYCLKIRSDMLPENNNFIKIWYDLARKPKKFRLFNKQILAYPIYTLLYEKDGFRKMPKPFHISDWAFFGETDDIKYLFDIPLVEEPYYSRYFTYHNGNNQYDTIESIKWQYSPEQYLFYTCFSKKFYTRFSHKRDYNKKNCNISRTALFENFIIADQEDWGIFNSKEFYRKPIYHYDERAYLGLVKFHTCISYRLKNFIPTPYEYVKKSLKNMLYYKINRILYMVFKEIR